MLVGADGRCGLAPVAMSGGEGSAWHDAVRQLARRDLGENEIRAALQRRGHPEADIAAALQRLTELGYVDDRRVARHLAERLVEQLRGSLLIEARLLARGFDPAIVAEAVGYAAADESQRARALLAQRHPDGLDDPRQRARAARFLHARGFPEAVVLAIIGEDW